MRFRTEYTNVIESDGPWDRLPELDDVIRFRDDDRSWIVSGVGVKDGMDWIQVQLVGSGNHSSWLTILDPIGPPPKYSREQIVEKFTR